MSADPGIKYTSCTNAGYDKRSCLLIQGSNIHHVPMLVMIRDCVCWSRDQIYIMYQCWLWSEIVSADPGIKYTSCTNAGYDKRSCLLFQGSNIYHVPMLVMIRDRVCWGKKQLRLWGNFPRLLWNELECNKDHIWWPGRHWIFVDLNTNTTAVQWHNLKTWL